MNQMQKKILVTFVTTLLPLTSLALTPEEEKGLEIAIEAEARDQGWDDLKVDMTMTIKNAAGQESVRQIDSLYLEVENDGDKSLVIFNKPADVKGTKFLTYSHALEPDEQWLYLPALKRVKRVSSRNKSGPFMGSEFAYEDLSSQEIEKYSYRHLGNEACPTNKTLTCFINERTPLYELSGYTRQVVWIDQQEYRAQKVDYYDRKNVLLKTLTFEDYQEYLGQYWRADKLTMINQQNGKSSILEFSNYEFQTNLSDSDFSRNRLNRN